MQPEVSPPEAVSGSLDLTHWDFARNGPIEISGQVEFYWQQLLTPQDFINNPQLSEQAHFVSIPTAWTNYELEGQPLPGQGYATYRLQFKLPHKPQHYGLTTDGMETASKVWLNGQPVFNFGIVGPNAQQSVPNDLLGRVYLPLSGSQNEIIVQVSNFDHRRGGLVEDIKLGLAAQIERQLTQSQVLAAFLCGSLMIMGLYYLGLYYFRPKERYTLLFAIFCILMSIRVIVTGDELLATIQPHLSWEWLLKIEYLTFYLSLPVFFSFFIQLYPAEYNRLVGKIIQLVGGLFSLVVIITPATIFTEVLFVYQLITVGVSLYLLFGMVKAFWRGRDGATLLLVGIAIFMLAVFNDILASNFIIQTISTATMVFFIFIFFQSIVLSGRFAKAFSQNESMSADLQILHQELEDHNRHLEETVARRTKALLEANTQMKDELSLAHQVQLGLLRPTKFEGKGIALRCYSAAMRHVGGDFYSYQAQVVNGREQYVVAVGDVSGKGVSAALLMATTLAQFEASLSNALLPIDRLIYLDKMILPYAKPHHLNCALCYVELSRSSAKSSWQMKTVNAAAIPPYIKRRDGSVESFEIGGFALGQGLSQNTPYPEIVTELELGDMVVVVSDGVIEAQNENNQLLGFEGFEQILKSGPTSTADAMLTYIDQELLHFIHHAEQHDDLTIVVIQIYG